MRIGVIGLGRMGANIARRLMQAGHSSVVRDASPAAAIDLLGKDGGTTATGLPDLARFHLEHTFAKTVPSAQRFGFGGRVELART